MKPDCWRKRIQVQLTICENPFKRVERSVHKNSLICLPLVMRFKGKAPRFSADTLNDNKEEQWNVNIIRRPLLSVEASVHKLVPFWLLSLKAIKRLGMRCEILIGILVVATFVKSCKKPTVEISIVPKSIPILF